MNSIQKLGNWLLGAVVMLALVILANLCIFGMGMVSATILPVLIKFTVLALLTLPVLLLLSIPQKTRAIGGVGIYILSFLVSLTGWAYSLLVALDLWGIIAVVLGLLLFGAGVIPIALLAALCTAHWSTTLELAVLIAIILTLRFLGLWVIYKTQSHSTNPNGTP